MPGKRQVLEVLKRDELLAALDAFELTVEDRRQRAPLVEKLARSRKAALQEVLAPLPRARLKEICRALELDDSGREKAAIVARLAGKKYAGREKAVLAPRLTGQMSDGILLPRPASIRIEGVQLYKNGGLVELDLRADFICTVGANGLGKSTLLNLLLYAITGLVLKPQHKLVPLSGKGSSFIGQGKDFARSYFEGRVARGDVERAQVTIEYTLGEANVVVTRGFLTKTGVTEYTAAGETSEAADLTTAYERAVTRLSRTASFSQLAFLIHTVQYFGEDPLCLFWKHEGLNLILSAAISGDAEQGLRHTHALSTYKRHDSRIRNLQWHISSEEKMLTAIAETTDESSSDLTDDDAERYRELVGTEEEEGRIENLERREVLLRERRSETRARRDEASVALHARISALEALTWELITERAVSVSESPVLGQLLSDHGVCPICRTEHQVPPVAVQRALEVGVCPLCATKSAAAGGADKRLGKREKLRTELANLREELQTLETALSSLAEELDGVGREIKADKAERDRLEREHSKATLNAARFLREQGRVGETVMAKQRGIEAMMKEKEVHLEERRKAKRQLEEARQELTRTFDRVRKQLIPMFQGLAHEFLGLQLTLTTKEKIEGGIPLVDVQLQVDGEGRRGPEELSASQRYFLDIALRMTILGWLGKSSETPFLAIDTPEGSLDIAYEVNAGAMFAKFVREHGGQLLSVSNLNSSRLIRETLNQCTKAGNAMKLQDLRDWGRLNQVQKDRQELMDDQVRELRRIIEGR